VIGSESSATRSCTHRKGSWFLYRGKVGTIVLINGEEFGVLFGRPPARLIHRTCSAWFRERKLALLSEVRSVGEHRQ